MGALTELPPRFPCWCKATYSWGGETKKDLGFIEGDLIEALNAGDGSWWMGRLRRDPRAIGLFPSNFVTVLDESFQPAPNSRNSSLTKVPSQIAATNKSKSVFRKPFQAYEEVGKRGSLDELREKEGTPESDKEKRKEKSKYRPYSSMKTAQAPTSTLRKQGTINGAQQALVPRIPSPPPRRAQSRPGSHRTSHSRSGASSKAKSASEHGPGGSIRSSPAPSLQPTHRVSSPQPHYRAPSPQPRYRAPSPQPTYRAASPQPMYRAVSPQPIYRAASPQPIYRAASPQPIHRAASPQPIHRTPSPALMQNQLPIPASLQIGLTNNQDMHDSYQPSQSSYTQQQFHSVPQSPSRSYDDLEDLGSSPPPPLPPAHRTIYQSSRAPSPQPSISHSVMHLGNTPRTPIPPSPSAGSHMTPSPLRDAMNDVMTSLYDMTLMSSPPAARPETPPNVWSPDAFELIRSQSRAQQHAQTLMGPNFTENHDEYGQNANDSRSLPSSQDASTNIDSYIQRMERQLQSQPSNSDLPPHPPLKGSQFSAGRPTTSDSGSSHDADTHRPIKAAHQSPLRSRKSAYELGRPQLDRSFTTKTNATNSTESSSATQSSTSTQLTSRSIMSGYSAGGFSATSAGSLARRKFGMGSQRSRGHGLMATKSIGDLKTVTKSTAMSEGSGSGPSYHESHSSLDHDPPLIAPDWSQETAKSAGVFGGFSAPKSPKRSGFFKKMIETAKTTAKTGAANARSTIGSASRPGSRSGSPTKGSILGNGTTSFSGGTMSRPTSSAGGVARDMGLGGGGNDWMQVRRDVNRSNSLSQRERDDRAERCQMHELPAINPIDHLYGLVEGDEGLDGLPIMEPTDFHGPNLALVDKSTRFIQSMPPMISATALAQNYVCRPHRSDVSRLRAIFTWVSERITWEEDFEGNVDTRRAIHSKRGCSEEFALLVRDMCNAIGLHAEVVHGYLKSPGEVLDLDTLARPNHWWNAVIIDGEWRIMDCALASPTHPRRGAYSTCSSQVAESWYFLARPMEICYTHIPLLPEQQHLVPSVEHEVLAALPFACPTYFRNNVELSEFNTSILHLENLEMAHLHLNVPEDVECVAESESRAFAQDIDGDYFESGDVVRKKCLAQAEWVGGRKRFTVKAILPGDLGHGVLKIYAGKRGLMHSIKDNPHALALALPLSHSGTNPPYDFFTRHPTPHAQRHDLYVVQPQCSRLVVNNTFVFCIRQHPSSLSRFSPDTWGGGGGAYHPSSSSFSPSSSSFSARPMSPNIGARPTSALSMVSATMSISGSQYSDSNTGNPMTSAQQKPAKLAVQSPSQKIIRLTRKQEYTNRGNNGGGGGGGGEEEGGFVTSWETVVKISERGTWRGLVLADRSARWCVFAEWECV